MSTLAPPSPPPLTRNRIRYLPISTMSACCSRCFLIGCPLTVVPLVEPGFRYLQHRFALRLSLVIEVGLGLLLGRFKRGIGSGHAHQDYRRVVPSTGLVGEVDQTARRLHHVVSAAGDEAPYFQMRDHL